MTDQISIDVKQASYLHHVGRGSELHGGFESRVIKAAVYGANDGIITTFAVVVAVAGAGLSPSIILILGIANLIADGLAMGLGDYLGERSEQRYKKHQYDIEKWEVQNISAEEAKELEEYFLVRGVNEPDVSQLCTTIQKYPKLWAELGFLDELGESPQIVKNLWHSGLATFVAFIAAGALPLLPYVLHAVGLPIPITEELYLSIISTGCALFLIGSLRTIVTKGAWWRNGMEMLAIGALAAGGAYISGMIIKTILPSIP